MNALKPTTIKKVFISYAPIDGSDFAARLHGSLENENIPAWVNNKGGIAPGRYWDNSIEDGIKECPVFLFVLTPGSAKSDNCRDEFNYAHKHGKTILTLNVIETDDTPMRMDRLQWIDFRSNFEIGFTELVEAIKKLNASEINISPVIPTSTIVGFTSNKTEPSVTDEVAAFAVLYSNPNDILYLPEVTLIGRSALLLEIKQLLAQSNTRILLYGFGGVGKTALAAQIAHDWLETNKGCVLWLRLSTIDEMEALKHFAQKIGADHALSLHEGEKYVTLRDSLREKNVKLVVLDDVWNTSSLNALQAATPRDIPLLATSWIAFPLPTIREVSKLEESDALTLLSAHANHETIDPKDGRALCSFVGYHPFSIELAAKLIKMKHFTIQSLLKQMNEGHFTHVQLPFNYSINGYNSIAALMDVAIENLPPKARETLYSWGAFFSPIITTEMMSIFLDDTTCEDKLHILTQYGLATYEPAVFDEKDMPITSPYFRLHDLIYAFVSEQSDGDRTLKAMQSCSVYVHRHSDALPQHHAALIPELPNIFEASKYAIQLDRWNIAREMITKLIQDSRLVIYRGYWKHFTEILEVSVKAAKEQGNHLDHCVSLQHLGTIFWASGDYDKSLHLYQEAMTIALSDGNKEQQGYIFANIANVYTRQTKYDKAIDAYKNALDIQEQIDNKSAQATILSNLGNVYRNKGMYDVGLDVLNQSLTMYEELNDVRGKGQSLGIIGSTYLAKTMLEDAIQTLQQAIDMRHTSGDIVGEGIDLGNLGIAFARIEQYDEAKRCLQDALNIHEAIGDRLEQSNNLQNLGLIYENLQDYDIAIQNYERALKIRNTLGLSHLVEATRKTLLRATEARSKERE